MRITRITVRNFRGVADRTIELPETGTTVIVGDNEVGKSSLVEALVLLFDLADDSKAARVRNVQPFGSDVAPEVEAELTLGGYRLTYSKRWLRTRSTELTVTGPGGSKQSFTGREAHNEADRLFRTYVDPVLWQTLLVGQGQSLVQPAPADAEPLIAAVTAESGTPADGASMPLVAAVEQEYLRYWTKGGRPTNDFARLTDELAAAQQQADNARQSMDAVATDIRRAERLSQDLTDIRGRLDDQAAAVDELERDSRLGEALLARRDAVVQKADTANARLENRTAARAERDRLIAEVDRRTEVVAELRERIAELEPAGDAHDTARADAQHALAAAIERRDERRTALHDAEQRLADLRDHAELARLTERRTEVEAVRERIATARATLESCRVTDELITALEEARAAVVVAEAALQAGAPQVVLRRLGGTAPVQVSDDATLFGTELTGTEQIKQRVSGELQVVIPGQLEVTVRAGGEVAGLRKALDVATRAEKQLLADAGAKDLAAAREQVRKRDVAAAELAESRRTEASLIAAGDPAERIAVLSTRLSQTPPDGDIATVQATVDELRGALTADEVAVTDAEFAAEQARKAADDDRSAVVRANAQLEVEMDRLTGAEKALADARTKAPDDDVLAAETEAMTAVESVIEELAALQAQVDDQGADELPVRLTEARQVLGQIRAEHDDLRDDLRTTEGRLQQSGTDGLATRLDLAEAALERCLFGYDLLRRRADAARRVRETLARHRTEAQNRYAEPLRSRIETLGRTVYGPTFSVTLDDDLAVAERELNGVRLPIEELSTGAREQLAIITRLAISHLVGTGEGSVPAIFDDALGWSDKGRLREMGALLGRAGEHGQVIVLTCVPERYEYVPGRNVIRLTG
jgi:hypothetical protein